MKMIRCLWSCSTCDFFCDYDGESKKV